MNEIHQEDLQDIGLKITDMILVNLSKYIECKELMVEDIIYEDILKILEIHFNYPYSRRQDY